MPNHPVCTSVCLALGSFLLIATAVTQERQDVVHTAVASVDREMGDLEKQGFSGVVLIMIDGQKALKKAYGVGDCAKRKLSPDAVFDLGSITKSFTAIAILKMQVAGRLSLSDPLSKYFPGVPKDKASITLEELLRHT